MRPRDYEPGGDSGAWEAEYEAWMAQGRALAEQQQAWRDALDRELSAVATLEVDVADAIAHRDALAAFDAHIVELEARITQARGAAAALDAPIASIRAEREAATAQLLGNIASGSPVVLLPVRVETRWIGPELWVRIFPDELEIDSHEPALTEDERVWAEHYWQAGEPLRLPAWRQLAGRFGVTRAAWIVAATDPQGSTERSSREGSWTRPPHAVALPDRWAVLGLVGEEPVVTAWSAPVATPLPAGPSPDHGVGADAGNQWLVDFEAAEAAGMAVRLTADPERVPRPLDALLVVGVRSADGDLAALLDAHHYTRGLRLVPSGTPTNNTHAARAGRARPDPDHAYAVERGPATDAGVSAARTLGVEPSVLEHVEAPALDDVHARAMQRVLAAAGGELRERLVAKAGPDAVAALWAHVRPAGQLPALLVGAQPYGILAATALDRWAASDGDATAAAGVALATAWPERRTLTAARTAWTDSLVDVITEHAASSHFGADGAELPTVGPAGPDGRLADPYLERIADAAPGAPVAVPPVLLARLAAAAMRAASGTDRQALADLLRQLATLPAERLHDLLASGLDVLSHRFDGWVTALAHRRLDELAGVPRVLGAYGFVHAPRPRERQPRTQGYVHAPSLGQAATAAVLRSGYAASSSNGTQADPLALDLRSDRVRKALWLLDGVRHQQPLGALLGYRFERRLSDAGLEHYIAEFRKLVRFRGTGELATLHTARDEATAKRAAAEVKQLRLDADAGAATDARTAADELRLVAEGARDAALAAVAPFRQHVKAYKDAETALGKASEAVSKHLAQKPEPSAIEIEITSPRGRERVEKPRAYRSEELVEWQLAHKPLVAAQTAARKDRDRLRGVVESEATACAAAEDALTLGQKDLQAATDAATAAANAADAATQTAARHRTDVLGPASTAEQAAITALADELRRQWREATTTTAVTAVVDGLELRRRFRAAAPDSASPRWDVTTIPFPASASPASEAGVDLPAVATPEWTRTLLALRDLDDHVDAVCDLLVAEGVHQLVQGNATRAGAALDALANGRVPAEIDVIRTPRPGIDAGHRVAVIIDRDAVPQWVGDGSSYRALAEPALDAWISRLLPDPATVVCHVTTDDADPLELTLDVLGLGALDLVHLGPQPPGAQHGELEQRIAHHVAKRVHAIDLDPDTEATTAAELLSAATAVRGLLADARPLRPGDLGGAAAVAPAELEARVAMLRERVGQLTERLAAAPRSLLVDLLFEAARCGLPEAVPPVLSGPDGLVGLEAHAASVRTQLEARLETHDAIELPAGDDGRTAALLERAATLIGRDLRVLPELGATLDPLVRSDLEADANRRLGVDGRATLRRFLIDAARVRPAVAGLLDGLAQAETLGTPEPLRLRLTQLPSREPDRWVGLDGGPPHAGRVAVLAHTPAAGVPEHACGLVVDEWTETVPGDTHLTGVAVHCDQPGANAPQAILVAVPPDLRATKPLQAWDLDTLIETVVGSLDLARLRVTAPDRLPAAVPVGVHLPDDPSDPT